MLVAKLLELFPIGAQLGFPFGELPRSFVKFGAPFGNPFLHFIPLSSQRGSSLLKPFDHFGDDRALFEGFEVGTLVDGWLCFRAGSNRRGRRSPLLLPGLKVPLPFPQPQSRGPKFIFKLSLPRVKLSFPLVQLTLPLAQMSGQLTGLESELILSGFRILSGGGRNQILGCGLVVRRSRRSRMSRVESRHTVSGLVGVSGHEGWLNLRSVSMLTAHHGRVSRASHSDLGTQ